MINIKNKMIVAFVALGLIGCSEPEPEVIDMDKMAAEAGLAPEDYTVHDNGAMEIESKVRDDDVLWYQDNLSEPIKIVGMLDGNDILSSAGLEAYEIEDSADHMGEPKKFYIINDNPLSASMSHSPNSIALNWYQYSDEPETIELSQQSLKDAYRLARAMAGREGSDAVMYLSNGGKYRNKPVSGYPATGQCNDGVCFINIDLNIEQS